MNMKELETIMIGGKKYVIIEEDDYNELQDESKFLDALRGAGVDNWDGYEYALEVIENS